jgi:hypothetical protein
VGGNVKAFDQLFVYIPIILKEPTGSTPPKPTPEPTQPPKTTGNIVIVTIHYDGTGSNESDEYVEFRNDDTLAIQLENWTLRDIANHVFTFPNSVIIPTYSCRIYTNEIHPEWCGFSYGSGSAIWNNTGDTATLWEGNEISINKYYLQCKTIMNHQQYNWVRAFPAIVL